MNFTESLEPYSQEPPDVPTEFHVVHRDDQTPSTPAVWGSRGGIGHPEVGLSATAGGDLRSQS